MASDKRSMTEIEISRWECEWHNLALFGHSENHCYLFKDMLVTE